MADPNKQPIIIKKVKKMAPHGHHGGSWKIAYADFVTAMMAFFLLMWLVNATSEEQRRGIANYFTPVSIGKEGGGNWGVMGGMSIKEKSGSMDTSQAQINVQPANPKESGIGGEMRGPAKNPDESGQESDSPSQVKSKVTNKLEHESDLIAKAESKQEADAPGTTAAQKRTKEDKMFENIKETIIKNINEVPGLKDLLKNVIIEQTEEGLRIQIMDQQKTAMFPNGSSRMYQPMRELLQKVSSSILDIPNKVSISGHTDSIPYRNDSVFGNWELSSERANACRRVMRDEGVNESRFESVVGRADKELFNKANPTSEENRRISIVVLRQK